jgi:hypothetical protein
VIEGFVVRNFTENCVYLYVGTNVTVQNMQLYYCGQDGIQSYAAGSLFTGNVVSGHGRIGILTLPEAVGTVIQGNIAGLDATGTFAIPNGVDGIQSQDEHSVIGGWLPGQGNIVSGNTRVGIVAVGAFASIVGNFVGTNKFGTAAIGNSWDGMQVQSLYGLVANNTASGNSRGGILTLSAHTRVIGNKCGTDATGSYAIPNALAGVTTDGINVTVGGRSPGEGNLCSGNSLHGIVMLSSYSQAIGNKVGTDITGSYAVGNGGDGFVVQGANVTVGRSIISGNKRVGLASTGAQIYVVGNLFGLDTTGSYAIPNDNSGAQFQGFGSVIQGNIFSGNRKSGCGLIGPSSSAFGNIIGLDLTGS